MPGFYDTGNIPGGGTGFEQLFAQQGRNPLGFYGSTGMQGGQQGGQFGAGGQQIASHTFQSPQGQQMNDQLLSILQSQIPQMNALTQHPLSSELFQGTIGPMLAALQPQLQRQQQDLTSAFRASGGLRDTSYGNALGNLLSNQQVQQQGMVAGQANQVFQNLMRALMMPTEAATQTAHAIPTLSESFFDPRRGMGGAGGGGGGGVRLGPDNWYGGVHPGSTPFIPPSPIGGGGGAFPPSYNYPGYGNRGGGGGYQGVFGSGDGGMEPYDPNSYLGTPGQSDPLLQMMTQEGNY